MAKDERTSERAPFAIPAIKDERWAVVERICNSAQLRRSAKLRDLLVYLCHRAWVEGADEIREHDIGVDVFQRPPGYDSTLDTLVRVQASQLRKRLERYFAEEGQGEDLVLEIAKGNYEPLLHERLPDALAVLPADLAPHAAVPVTAPARSAAHRTVRVLAVVCAALTLLCLWLAFRPTATARDSALRRFWAGFAPDGEETTVVLADAAFSAMQDVLRRPIPLNEYAARGYRAELNRPGNSPEKREFLSYLMERRYTSLADVMLVKRLWSSAVLDPARTTVLFSRDLHLRNMQKGNQILVGSRRAVPWVDLFEHTLDFHYIYQEGTRSVRVENRRPRPGEPKFYDIPENHPHDRFSVVASIPNPSNTGNVLILSGQEMAGTEAAATLMTTERLFDELLAKLPPQSSGVPRFEALLRVQHVEYTMQGYEILAVHPH